MNFNYIDLEKWNRKVIFEHYLGTDYPYISMSASIDVTNLYEFTHSQDLSFYYAMIYIATRAADSIENFRYRFKDEKPFILDKNRPVFTHIPPDNNDLFVMGEGAPADNIIDFCKLTKVNTDNIPPGHGFELTQGKYDYINYSCIPWVNYIHLMRPVSKRGGECTPKISWGKFEKNNSKLIMTISVQIHHGLMDGIHIGKYIHQIEEYINTQDWQ